LDNWRSLIEQKDELVGALRKAKYTDLLPSYNHVAYLEGKARLTKGGIQLNGELLQPNKIIVATGSSAALPSIPGIDEISYLTSTEALDLKELPRSMLVIGGGYIGCELAQLFAVPALTSHWSAAAACCRKVSPRSARL